MSAFYWRVGAKDHRQLMRRIDHAIVARGSVVLAEHDISGDPKAFEETISALLLKIPTASDQTLYYTQDDVSYHILIDNKLTFLCVCNQSVGKYVPLKFLQRVRSTFFDQFGDRAQFARAGAFDADFRHTLEAFMIDTSYANNEKIGSVQSELDQAKKIMEQNIDKVINRGERLDDLVDKTENLKMNSIKFASTAKKVRRHYFCRHIRITILMIIILIVVVFLVVMFSCGGPSFSSCRK